MLGLDVDDNRTVIGYQEVIRDVLTDLSRYPHLQQERLGQDAMHRPVEVSKYQPRQLQARLIDHMVALQYSPE
jgi:hypothetical protein